MSIIHAKLLWCILVFKKLELAGFAVLAMT